MMEVSRLNQIVPPRFLFRFSFAAKKIVNLPRRSGKLLDLPEICLLPSLAELDHQTDFAHVKLAWNEKGFGISMEVTGRTQRPEIPKTENARRDGIELWIDTRNTQSVHRATKFCHHFLLHPMGTAANRETPFIRSLPVARAREENPLPNAELVNVHSEISKSGYLLEAWFPREVLVGFDPDIQSQIGFHYIVQDSEFGSQTLAVGNEFPFESDPSLWQTVELIA